MEVIGTITNVYGEAQDVGLAGTVNGFSILRVMNNLTLLDRSHPWMVANAAGRVVYKTTTRAKAEAHARG